MPKYYNNFCCYTLPGTNNTSISVFGWATNVAPYTNGTISNLVIDNTNNISTFNFNGNFLDFNNSQTFRVQYYISGQQHYTEFTYTKIKSFQTTVSESIPLLTPNSITANRCQIQNFNISFNNVQFANPWVNPKQVYGTEAGYEYLLPVGWVLNGTTSTGSNWITGANNVTVTSDLSHGNGENIQIRAVNSCGTNLIKGPIAYIPVSRPRPTLSISGDDFICSDSKSYTIIGTLPPGATVCWSSSNTNYATVPTSNCGTTVPVTFVSNGVITLTATITDCIETYTVTKDILIGAAIGGYYRIASDYHNYGIFNPLYNNNSPIWLPANQTFGVDVWLNSPGIQSVTWTRSSNSYPFYWNTMLSFSGTSGSTAYQERDGIFNLTAQTTCGAYNGTFKWPVIVQGWGFSVEVSPNPASDNLTVSIKDKADDVKSLSKEENIIMTLYNLNGTTAIKSWSFKNNENKFKLNLSDIRKGQYILVVRKGKYQQSKQVIIE